MQDQVAPTGRWQFDEEVSACFDDMLRRSIPQIDVMRRAVNDLAVAYVQPETALVDLGCSRGDAMAALVERFPLTRFVGVEVSEPMLEWCRYRFAAQIEAGQVSVEAIDLRDAYPSGLASVTLAVLSMQFTPIEHRQRILRDVWRHTAPGGAFIMVEKVLGATAELDAGFVSQHYGMKGANGYTEDQIRRKRLSLEGVLVPVTARWNEELLKMAGFSQVDCFWRWMNFAGWLALK